MKNTTPQGAVARRLLRRRQVEQVLGLSKSAKVKQANRRKFGEDDGFPLDQSEETDSGGDSNALGRFSADPAMKGMRLGKPTDRGHEVFDANGKLIGHYN